MNQRVDAYAVACLEVARAEGVLGDVEDEIFRFARTFEGSPELRDALTNRTLPSERRQALVEELVGAKAHPVTTALLTFIVTADRAKDLPAIAEKFVAQAAAERSHAVAEVHSAIPLDASQIERLTQALNISTGKQVEVKVVVDPSVLGGLVAHVGDLVIDGTVRHRLDQLKERI